MYYWIESHSSTLEQSQNITYTTSTTYTTTNSVQYIE